MSDDITHCATERLVNALRDLREEGRSEQKDRLVRIASTSERDLKEHLRQQYTPAELRTLIHEAVDVLAGEEEAKKPPRYKGLDA